MGTSTSPITVVIADEHEIARAGIRVILQTAPDIALVGEAANGLEAKQLIERLRPNVAVLDLVMSDASPSDITMWAYKHHPETAILIVTGHSCDCYLMQILQAGAAGFLGKNAQGQELIHAILRAADGQTVFTQEQRRRAQEWQSNVQTPWKRLTPREQDVLRLIASGMKNREIAERLQISRKTVEKHICRVFATIGVKSRTEAALWLQESGLE